MFGNKTGDHNQHDEKIAKKLIQKWELVKFVPNASGGHFLYDGRREMRLLLGHDHLYVSFDGHLLHLSTSTLDKLTELAESLAAKSILSDM